eukprot:6490918-Prymnesium_polylepis.1
MPPVQGILLAEARVPGAAGSSSAPHHPAWVALLVCARLPLLPLMLTSLALGCAAWLPLRAAAAAVLFAWQVVDVPLYACAAPGDTFLETVRAQFGRDLCAQQQVLLLHHPHGLRAWAHLRLWA